MTVVLASGSTLAQQSVGVTIDAAATRQTMQGFGATTISLVYNTKDNVPSALRAAANDLAFNQIELNMGNLEVEPSESPGSNVYAPANDNDDPATLNAYQSSNPTRYLEELAEHVFAVLKHWRDAYGIDQPYVQL